MLALLFTLVIQIASPHATALPLLEGAAPSADVSANVAQWNQFARREIHSFDSDVLLPDSGFLTEESQALTLVQHILSGLRQNLLRPHYRTESPHIYRNAFIRVLWAASRLKSDDQLFLTTFRQALRDSVILVNYCLRSVLNDEIYRDQNNSMIAQALGFLSQMGGSQAVLGITLVLGRTEHIAALHPLAVEAMILAAKRSVTLEDCDSLLFGSRDLNDNRMR